MQAVPSRRHFSQPFSLLTQVSGMEDTDTTGTNGGRPLQGEWGPDAGGGSEGQAVGAARCRHSPPAARLPESCLQAA